MQESGRYHIYNGIIILSKWLLLPTGDEVHALYDSSFATLIKLTFLWVAGLRIITLVHWLEASSRRFSSAQSTQRNE